jgi:replication factor C large subunit
LSAMTHHCTNRELTVAIAARYDLDAEHVAFVTGSGEDTNKVQSIVEDAAQRSEEAAVEGSEGAFEGATRTTEDETDTDDEPSDSSDGDETDAETDESESEDDDSQSGLADFY